jgi:hypothetical protein
MTRALLTKFGRLPAYPLSIRTEETAMTTFVTILTDDYADWETALLNAVAKGYYGVETHFATPGGRPVTSAGGLTVTPDMAIEDIDLEAVDVLLVNGGTAWAAPSAPDISTLAQDAVAAGKIVVGMMSNSLSMTADGIHSLMDGASNVVGLVGIAAASAGFRNERCDNK